MLTALLRCLRQRRERLQGCYEETIVKYKGALYHLSASLVCGVLIQKWKDFRLENVTLELHEAVIYQKSNKDKNKNKNKNLIERDHRDEKIFIAFEIDSICEKRPFLLSRDFVFVRPSGKKGEPFRGFINRVVKSTRVLAEIGDDFHSQHSSSRKYDVTFSFNRVCLKRSHQAVAAAMDPLFRDFLFPDQSFKSSIPSLPLIPSHQKHDQDRTTAVLRISMLNGPSPYLIEGPLSVTKEKRLSRTGLVIRDGVLQLYRTYPGSRILINAPTNSTCDKLMISLKKEIPVADMFRANAAFRKLDGVPDDILPSCLYKGECFTCPPVLELRNYKVIFSTFVSRFRLYDKGVSAGHFSHIFLVDASSATEPETMVALANLADEKTPVVVTGSRGNCSGWVRSNIARENGLRMSYFQRLFESKLYRSLDPMFVTQLGN
ncbi:hypothetical protein HHK36_024076 [Tetracentron sinense]|uniref:Helicase MOV-10-like beta-barrel domain-containing protein n=1 Tax=Tetracentron sinense TaxID=13715 RepID=A0A834YKC2_TETSI|nr:hypothetical protein HHK36_024076 [Tetracentron sinense]